MPAFYVPGLALVRVLLAGGSAEHLQAAESWLARQIERAEQLHNIHAQIQCYVLAAALRGAEGDQAQALRALSRALALAEHGQVVRVFVDLARELAPLFDALAAALPLSGFPTRVHSALQIETQSRTTKPPAATEAVLVAPAHNDFQDERDLGARPTRQDGDGHGADARDLRELLTYREMDVLRLLDQRLTNKEIAHALGISTETVRQHTVNLFRKLNVNNRRQAIVVARSRGYFEDPR